MLYHNIIQLEKKVHSPKPITSVVINMKLRMKTKGTRHGKPGEGPDMGFRSKKLEIDFELLSYVR